MSDRIEYLVEYVRDGIIGSDEALDGPYGPRRVTYADHTASGQPIELPAEYGRRDGSGVTLPTPVGGIG